VLGFDGGSFRQQQLDAARRGKRPKSEGGPNKEIQQEGGQF